MASSTSLREKYDRLKGRMSSMAEKSSEALEQGLQTAEVVGTCFVMGAAQARYGDEETGDLEVAGVPISLGAGIFMHGLALFGGFSSGSKDLPKHGHNVGDGFLSAFFFTKGMQLGTKLREESNAAVEGRRSRGQLHPGSHVGSDADVVNEMANRG